jgi:hypothetical protein
MTDPGSVEYLAYFYTAHGPPEWWIKQALLLYDRFCSDLSATELAARKILDKGDSNPIVLGDEALWLIDQGIWVAHPPFIYPTDPMVEFKEMIGRFSRPEVAEDGFMEWLLGWYARSITEQAAAASSSKLRVIPFTDSEHVFNAMHANWLNNSADGEHARELLLDGFLPIPGSEVSFADVISFRDRYRSELLAFRIEIEDLIAATSESDDGLRAVARHRQSIEKTLGDVERAARGRRMRFVRSGLTAIVTGAVASHLPPDSLHWIFDGAGVAVAVELSGYRGRRLPGPFDYLVRAHQTHL